MMISALRSETTHQAPTAGRKRGGRILAVLASAAIGLGLTAGVAQAEGSADLIKRGKGFRAALLAADPTLGIVPPDGRESVSLHFAYLNEGEYLNMSSSAQGIGQGKIVYRDPTGMSNRCDPSVGYIENLATEKAGAAAGNPCSVRVEPGLAGIWEVEFLPPSAEVAVERYEPVFGRDAWAPQTESDFWVRAWDVSVSTAPLADGGAAVPGRTYVRTFAGIVGAEAETGQPWNSIWFGRTSDGFVYALDTNGIKGSAFNLLGSTHGLKDATGESLYASATLDALGTRAFLADPYAFAAPGGEQSLKLFYNRPDQSQPPEATSSLMGAEWLNTPIGEAQTMTELTFDAERNVIVVTVNGEGVSNALELFDADDTGADGIVQFTYTNLPSGTSLLKLPTGISGALVGRFTAKRAEMHFPMANIANSQTGIRIRRMNGDKDGTGDLFWNLGFEPGRFDGDLVNSTNSLRGVAGAWGPEKGLGRINDVWAMNAVQVEMPLSLPMVETDLSLELALIAIEPAATAGAQMADVELILRNEGASNTSVIRIDIAETGGVAVEGVDGALFQDGAVFVDDLPAGETLRATLRVLVTSANDPLAMAITGQALPDSNLVNDVGLVIFPEPVSTAEPVLAPVEEAIAADPVVSEPLAVVETEAETAVEIVAEEGALDAIMALDDPTMEQVAEDKEPFADPLVEPVVELAADPLAGAVPNAAELVEAPDQGQVDGRLKTDLIALRKRTDGDQIEADLMFALSNTGTETLTNVSLQVSPKRHLGEAFVSMVGEPIFEIEPMLPGSWVGLNPGFTGFPGSDEVFLPGGVLRPKDSVMLRMTVHYDQDALGGISPLSMRGDFLASANDTDYRFPSDNDLLGGKVDENGDGNPLNDSTPLPGLRLIKSVKVLPGPTRVEAFSGASDVVFEYVLENTGGMVLENLAMADLFVENEAVTEILDVEILSVETASSTFTATDIPDAFVGVNTVQRFEGGEAILQPGEEVRVSARVVFTLDEARSTKPILTRAAAFARVDVDGDGTLDSVVGDPADSASTMGFDADGDGEEGNDAAPVGLGRMRLATLISGRIETDGPNSFLLLTTQTTATNTGTTKLGNIAVDLPLPETMIVEFIDLVKPATITVQPASGEAVTEPLTYDGIDDFRMIDEMLALDLGDSFTVEAEYRFLVGGIDPLALTDMQAFGTATVDRDRDGFADFEIAAESVPTQFNAEGGIAVVEQLVEAQLATEVAAAIAPVVGLAPDEVTDVPGGIAVAPTSAEAAAAETVSLDAPTALEQPVAGLSIVTTEQDVSDRLATSGFVAASDGEVLIADTPQMSETTVSPEAALAAIEETLAATNAMLGEDDALPGGEDDILPGIADNVSTYEPLEPQDSAEIEAMIAAIDAVMIDDPMSDDVMVDDVMVDDVMVDDVMIEDVMIDDVMIDDVMIDDVMIDDVMIDDVMIDDGRAAGPAAVMNYVDPVQQFQQEQMTYQAAGGAAAPAVYQSAPVVQQRFVRPPKVVRKLIPGPKIGFPAGSVPVSLTSGFQLAVPQGYQAYQAPDGSFFLMRKR